MTCTDFRLDFNQAVNGELIQRLAESLPQLQSLSLGFCGNDQSIDADALLSLTKLDQLSQVSC